MSGPVLLAGMTLGVDVAGATDFVVMSGITSLGEIGDVAESKESTTLSDTRKQYSDGMTDSSESSLAGHHLESDTVQATLVTAAKAKATVTMQITWTDGATATFTAKLLGFKINEASSGDDWKMFNMPYRQITDVVWA